MTLYCDYLYSMDPTLGLFSASPPTLLYYSYLPVFIFALFLGIFAVVKDRHSIAAWTLFGFCMSFAASTLFDLHTWTSNNILSLTFWWEMIFPMDILMSVFLAYFCYAFIEKKHPPVWAILLGSGLIIFSFVGLLTGFFIDYFDNGLCEAHENIFGAIWFNNGSATAVIFVTLAYLFRRCRRTVQEDIKDQIKYLAGGVIAFYVLFSVLPIWSQVTLNWPISMYGYFGTTIFLGMLIFLITKYGAFNAKFFGTQALVWTAGALIASLLFLQGKNLMMIRLVATSTFILLLIFGIILIRSVRREIEQREELKRLTDELKGFNDHLEEKIEAQKTEIQKRYETEKRSGEEAKILSNAKTEFILSFQERFGKPADDVIHTLKEVSRGTSGALATALEKAVNASDRFRKLISELGNIATIKERAAAMQKKPTALLPLFEDIKQEFQEDLENKKLSLNIYFSPEAREARPIIDTRLVREAIFNIVDNAVKYTTEGGITVKAEIKDNKLIITIKDTGIGMTKEEQGKIFFSAFERGEEAKALYTTGRGIGLMLSKSIIEAHNGHIYAESEGKGKGSVFTVELSVV